MKSSIDQNEDHKFEKSLLIGFAYLFVIIGLVILICFFNKIGNHFEISPSKAKPDLSITGFIGDFIGGVVGTFFSIAGFVILVITLRDQKEAFLKERFEQRLFEMIKLHSQNVSEFEIAEVVKGRDCFKYMINELRFIYRLVEIGALNLNLLQEKSLVNSRIDYLKMAYLIMFFGIGYSSERQLMEIFNKDESEIFKLYIKTYLEGVQEQYKKETSKVESKYFTLLLPLDGLAEEFILETRFYPFEGYSSMLGHYFRMLFQTVKYIDSQPDKIVSKDEKYGYTKNVRAILSIQEQLILYYNSLSSLGSDWISEKNNLLKKYALIKNIPLAIIDIGIHPHEIFGILNDDGKYLFETDEIKSKNINE